VSAATNGRSVAIVQSSYIPWKGYFDMIAMVDEFILYDDRQFTRRDWRNRNRIKTPDGVRWLTIPVAVKGRYHQRIDETVVADPRWAMKHWERLRQVYRRAPHFARYEAELSQLYAACATPRLSEINRIFIEWIAEQLDITTRLRWSTEYEARGEKTERLVTLCLQAGATHYLSGPRARVYLEPKLFSDAGIAVSFMEYRGYREYPQVHPPFDHRVTALDLLFATGPEARSYMLN
jgi:WbqC-like protein family